MCIDKKTKTHVKMVLWRIFTKMGRQKRSVFQVCNFQLTILMITVILYLTVPLVTSPEGDNFEKMITLNSTTWAGTKPMSDKNDDDLKGENKKWARIFAERCVSGSLKNIALIEPPLYSDGNGPAKKIWDSKIKPYFLYKNQTDYFNV